jgi:transposase
MKPREVPKVKQNAMRRLFMEGKLDITRAAKEIRLARTTVVTYKKQYELILAQCPDKLPDMNFYLPRVKYMRRSESRREDMMNALPALLEGESPGVTAKPLWDKYKLMFPDHYSRGNFNEIFRLWLLDHPEWAKPLLLKEIAEKDRKMLDHWRHCNDRRKWQIAVTLDMARSEIIADVIVARIESTRESVYGWIKIYKAEGLAGLEMPKRASSRGVVDRQQQRKDQLFHILQDTPKMHGINRTSWSITCLHLAYNEKHKQEISWAQVDYCLRQMGFRYQKSREVLSSPDPKFREKIGMIQKILQHLRPDEKFFSIDEYGPVGVKMKGGKTLKHRDEKQTGIVKKQKSKGVIICTAALELSANQVTHFYSTKKNTFEMIRLIDVLLQQYHDQKTLYLSWDAVSWHRSGILMNYIEDHNGLKKGPVIKLAPLPSTTQYLNVIESVFGGLARAVIHNSDYGSMDECKAAIDLHFSERNRHFLEHPQRAGRKIWGKEPVVPEFKDNHVCRNSAAMRGAK